MPTYDTSGLFDWVVTNAPGLDFARAAPLVPADPRPLTDREWAYAENEQAMRRLWLDRAGDPRRDVRKETGVPDAMPDAAFFLRAYSDDPIAGRVCEVFPRETYKTAFDVWEDDDEKSVTAFEDAYDNLSLTLRGEQSWYKGGFGSPLVEELMNWDTLSRVCRYSVLVLGIDDGLPLSQPARGIEEANTSDDGYVFGDTAADGTRTKTPKSRNVNNRAKRYELINNAAVKPGESARRKLVYARAYTEASARATRWERNRTSPRYGLPTAYMISFTDPLGRDESYGQPTDAQEVHWTRVLHLKSDGLLGVESRTDGVPVCWPVWPQIYALQKIYGADGEGFWLGAIASFFLATDPGADPNGRGMRMDVPAIKTSLDRMFNSTQRWAGINNLKPIPLPSSLADPTPHVATHLQAICVKLACPMRKFLGSERGELASSQDDGDWNDVVRGRQETRAVPKQIVPLVDRLIMLGVLPPPESGDGYKCGWKETDVQTPLEKAQAALARLQALGVYTGGSPESVYSPRDMWVNEFGKTPEEADALLEAADEYVAEQQDKQIQDQQAQIDAGVVADPTGPPDVPTPGQQPIGNEGLCGNCRNPLHPGPCKGWKKGAPATPPPSKTKPKTAPKPTPTVTPVKSKVTAKKPKIDLLPAGKSRTGEDVFHNPLPRAASRPYKYDADAIWRARHDDTRATHLLDPMTLKSTQPVVLRRNLDAITGAVHTPIVVVRHKGELYVEEGNHRAVKAALAGKKVPARIVESSGDAPPPKPPRKKPARKAKGVGDA